MDKQRARLELLLQKNAIQRGQINGLLVMLTTMFVLLPGTKEELFIETLRKSFETMEVLLEGVNDDHSDLAIEGLRYVRDTYSPGFPDSLIPTH